MNYLKTALGSIIKSVGLEQATVLYGYLKASGWFGSFWARKPIDATGSPLPWYSYPCIHFLDERLPVAPRSLRVFEFGSGNSTLWWSVRASQIVSVEDDKKWHSYIQANRPSNVTYVLAENEDAYIGCLFAQSMPFDVIVVDGSHREKCLAASVSRLREGGVVLVDNSDWPSLASSLRALEKQGFRRLEFHGIGPLNGHPWGTSILYRDGNILGL